MKNVYFLRIAWGVLCIFVLFATGCEDKSVYKGGDLGKEDVFDFSTTQRVHLDLKYSLPEGYAGKFEAYTENPVYVDEYKNYMKKEEVKPFMTGVTLSDGTVRFPLELPAYISEVYLYSPVVGVPALLKAKIENGKIALGNVQAEPKIAYTKSRVSSPYYTDWKQADLSWSKLAGWSKAGVPENLLPEGIALGKEDMEIINATIPYGKLLDLRFCGIDVLSLSEDANVKIYYVSRGISQRENAIAYYVYEGDTHPTREWVNDHLIMLYPALNDDVLKPGEGIQLKYYNESTRQFENKFPAGSNIGMVLLIDAWKGNGEISSKTNVMYSNKRFNSYTIPGVAIMGSRPQMAIFKTHERVILSFEDQPWTENPNSPYLGDFRDNVFVLDVDPIKALPEIPDGQDPETPDGTVNNYYAKQGILAFEDNWPYKGDYDMNDVVVSYNSSTYCSSDWFITGVIDTFVFVNNGAKYENGFGYEMGIQRTDIEKIEIVSDYQCPGQGLDQTLDKATVMLFDNGKNVPEGTIFIVKIWLKRPASSLLGYTLAPYNPFITVGNFMGDKRKEIHLVNYNPTPKADMDLLGYGHDLSDPAKGIYYISDADYPFALDLNGLKNYRIPVETHKISEFYPKFDKWVTSGKKENTDWYLHPAE